jgi:transcriptional regulator with XRE-family HTH domain
VVANNGSTATTHFGRQMRKERLAHGWSLREFQARTGVDIGSASLIETGKRPPTLKVALACDEIFPERRGWFVEYYEESKSWVPAGFRNWAEYEDRAVRLYDWWPSIISGLLQTEDYAHAHLSTLPGATSDVIAARLASRMGRQKRVLTRDESPQAWFVVDEMALYRLAGSAEIMAGQMTRLLEVASMPKVTVTVMPLVIHTGNDSGFIIADDAAAFAEHVASAGVYTDEQLVSRLLTRFASLQAESYRASESLRMIERVGETWASGVNPLSALRTAGHA